MKLIPIIADRWRMDGGVAFGVVPKSIWQRMYPADENNTIEIVCRCLLIDTGERLILIDTGMGRKMESKVKAYLGLDESTDLISSLQAEGYSAEDITDVIFTHLHDDHMGGAVGFDENDKLTLTFPNARHWASAAQWKWALSPNKREASSYFPDNLNPLKDIMEFIEDEGPFDENIWIELKHGHTMGHIVPVIRDIEHTYVYCGDFIPSSAHVHIPFVSSFDIQPLIAMEEKEQFLDFAVEGRYVLIFEHDPTVESGRVELTEKGYRVPEPILVKDLVGS